MKRLNVLVFSLSVFAGVIACGQEFSIVNRADNTNYGPFLFKDGTKVKILQAYYLVRDVGKTGRNTLVLETMDGKRRYGPFNVSNGSQFLINDTPCAFKVDDSDIVKIDRAQDAIIIARFKAVLRDIDENLEKGAVAANDSDLFRRYRKWFTEFSDLGREMQKITIRYGQDREINYPRQVAAVIDAFEDCKKAYKSHKGGYTIMDSGGFVSSRAKSDRPVYKRVVPSGSSGPDNNLATALQEFMTSVSSLRDSLEKTDSQLDSYSFADIGKKNKEVRPKR